MEVPRKINLGSGKDFREDCLNIDVNALWRPDLVLDISRPFSGSETLVSEWMAAAYYQAGQDNRFNPISLCEGYFDEIIANDVLEHIVDLVPAMTNCLRLLRVGGKMEIIVPYDLSYGAWSDPTHVRAFNERSWLYYTDWFWYLGWTTHRFIVKKLDLAMEEGFEREADSRKTAPRAIAAMQVTLEKVELTEEEKKMPGMYYARY